MKLGKKEHFSHGDWGRYSENHCIYTQGLMGINKPFKITDFSFELIS
jgi:hypothetical protein